MKRRILLTIIFFFFATAIVGYWWLTRPLPVLTEVKSSTAKNAAFERLCSYWDLKIDNGLVMKYGYNKLVRDSAIYEWVKVIASSNSVSNMLLQIKISNSLMVDITNDSLSGPYGWWDIKHETATLHIIHTDKSEQDFLRMYVLTNGSTDIVLMFSRSTYK